MKRLSIIGCGKVGKTFAALWQQSGTFLLTDILDQSYDCALQATAFLKVGRAVEDYNELDPVDVFLIATPDQAITGAVQQLAAAGVLTQGSIVFHCSGVASSRVLAPALEQGAGIASVHPIQSFADPVEAAANFAGTFCGIEGSATALEVLKPALEAIGARSCEVDPEQKTVYHAASVFASNYLTTLVDISGHSLEKSGIPRATALALIEPIVRGTVDNIFKLGTARALTGPIVRGDAETVARHLEVLTEWDQQLAELYRQLGCFTLELSRQQGTGSAEQVEILTKLLERPINAKF